MRIAHGLDDRAIRPGAGHAGAHLLRASAHRPAQCIAKTNADQQLAVTRSRAFERLELQRTTGGESFGAYANTERAGVSFEAESPAASASPGRPALGD
jgi:hypothetical protein